MRKNIYVVAMTFASIRRPILETHWAVSHQEAVGMSVMKRSDLNDMTGLEVISPNTDPNGCVVDLIIKTYNPGRPNKIETIKAVKSMTGWGLKEAKNMVDQVIKDNALDCTF